MKWVSAFISVVALLIALWSASFTMQQKEQIDSLELRSQYLKHEQEILYNAACKHQGFIDRILRIQGDLIQMMKQRDMIQPQPGDLLL